jgi:hypothetical protein
VATPLLKPTTNDTAAMNKIVIMPIIKLEQLSITALQRTASAPEGCVAIIVAATTAA